MTAIFNYQSLKVHLKKDSRTLFINFEKANSPDDENSFTMETLFELESLLAWCSSHIEIHSLFISSSSDYFSHGYNKEILKKLSPKKLQKFTKKLQYINQAIMLLPQTVIIDMQMGTKNIASEFATACDIRIANRSCKVSFEHTAMGTIACSGGIAQLSHIVGQAHTRNWLLTNADIPLKKLEISGFVYESYTQGTRQEVIDSLLDNIHSQHPVQRIQTKLGIVESVRESIEKMNIFERQISRAAMITNDWQADHTQAPMKGKNMKTAVQLSLVSNDCSENN